MKLNLLITLFLVVFFFNGCKKGENANEIIPPPKTELGVDEVAISGSIKNPDGSDAEGVEVAIDGHKIITPASGFFEFAGKVSNADKVKLSVSKNGYFKYTKILTLEENSTMADLLYYLAPEQTTGSFESASGGTVTASYATLVFQPNSFAKEDGSSYNGNVSVKMPYDILSDYENKLPGDNRASTAANEKVVIERWGGMNVRVYNDAGQPLKLIKPVSYKYKIDWRYVYIYNSKQARMKLWNYNEADDTWKEAGDVTMNGQYFSGSTSSLSYLQWGIPYPQALLRAYVGDANSNAASFFKIGCGLDEFNGTGLSGVKINSKGIALMYVAANVPVRTYIVTPCNDFLDALLLNPIATDKKAEQRFTVNLAPYITTFEGKLEDCDFKGVKGRAEYTFDGKKMTSVLDNGNFKFTFLHCHSISYFAGKLTVYDEQNKVIHTNDTYLIGAGIKNNYSATLCAKQQTGKITVVVQGKTYTFETPKDNVLFSDTYDNYGNLMTLLQADNASRKESFYLTYPGHVGGDVNIYTLGFGVPSNNYLMTWGLYEPGTAHITKYKTGNTIIEGTFKTKANLNYSGYGSNEVVELNGSFSVSR
jgi:hypothetical protein